jgi:hypothetical protein
VETQNRYRLFYQLTRITRDKGSLAKDDRVDALALAVHYWTSQMDRDVERARRDHENKLKDQQVRDFIKSYRGHLPPGPNYGGRREPTSNVGLGTSGELRLTISQPGPPDMVIYG